MFFDISGQYKSYSISISGQKVAKSSYLRAQNGPKWPKFIFSAILGHFGPLNRYSLPLPCRAGLGHKLNSGKSLRGAPKKRGREATEENERSEFKAARGLGALKAPPVGYS